jgi:thioredoxin
MKKVLLIDFYADWCGPCRMLTPIIEKLKEHYKDNSKVTIDKVNVDSTHPLASALRIRSVPTVAIFVTDDSENQITSPAWMGVGINSFEFYSDLIDKALG